MQYFSYFDGEYWRHHQHWYQEMLGVTACEATFVAASAVTDASLLEAVASGVAAPAAGASRRERASGATRRASFLRMASVNTLRVPTAPHLRQRCGLSLLQWYAHHRLHRASAPCA